MRSRLPPLPGAAIDAAIAAGLVWFFAAIVFERPDSAPEMAGVAAVAVFLVEFARRSIPARK
ncbi:hypothetical protein [Sphingomicrobium astaxanthinifaciens]|uniref:hypothetical protein n=1 Tax=Sphingomicrobium astaxanthinifaciens TaxID=1227949 RepID=UPI001FCCB083|nr:hypothetical protein [Sphingomicrobium astaxanthinifaciens]MCJ7421039.1 hypothetical protein [Sphingomicrobium astaxanthinifaciens]